MKPFVVVWCRNEATENLLKEGGLKYCLPTPVKIDKINMAASIKNNARVGEPVIGDVKRKYTGFMKMGRVFHAVVIYEPTMTIMAGVHRVEAASDAGADSVDAYLVSEADQEKIDTFTRLDNTQTGSPPTEKQLMEHCIHLHLNHGRPLREAVIMCWGTTENYGKAMARVHQQHVVEKLKEAGAAPTKVDKTLRDNPEILDKLYPLCPKTGNLINQKVLKDTFSEITEHKMNASQATNMVQEAKKGKTEREQLQIVKQQSEVIKEEKARPAANTEGTLLRDGLSRLYRLLCNRNKGEELTKFSDFDITDEKEIRELKDKIVHVSRALNKIKDSWTKKGKK